MSRQTDERFMYNNADADTVDDTVRGLQTFLQDIGVGPNIGSVLKTQAVTQVGGLYLV